MLAFLCLTPATLKHLRLYIKSADKFWNISVCHCSASCIIIGSNFLFYLSFLWVSRWSNTVPGGAQARPEKKKTSPRMNEWLNKIKWMYCNIQWVELLSHHQPIHYTERERERIWHEVDSEQDRGEGRSWEALKELHLFEEWLSCRGASDDDERWLRCCFFENLLAPRTTGKAERFAGRKTKSELITLLVDKHFLTFFSKWRLLLSATCYFWTPGSYRNNYSRRRTLYSWHRKAGGV